MLLLRIKCQLIKVEEIIDLENIIWHHGNNWVKQKSSIKLTLKN